MSVYFNQAWESSDFPIVADFLTSISDFLLIDSNFC